MIDIFVLLFGTKTGLNRFVSRLNPHNILIHILYVMKTSNYIFVFVYQINLMKICSTSSTIITPTESNYSLLRTKHYQKG